MPTEYKAVVVGAGPVGAALALSLAELTSQQILLVDSSQNLTTTLSSFASSSIDPRIFAINSSTRQLLESLDVWSDIEATRVQPYERMYVWDAAGTGNIHFDAAELDLASLGHIVEAKLIQTALLSAALKQPNIELLFPESIADFSYADGVVNVDLQSGRSLSAELLCGADGARSVTRGIAGISASEKSLGQQAIVANVFHELPHENCAWQIFHSTGPLAFLPLPERVGEADSIGESDKGDSSRHMSSIVWSMDDALAETTKKLDDKAFEYSLTRAIEERFGQVSLASERMSFPLSQMHVANYVEDGFALLGDAAHRIHPLAGLGANLGFQDVEALTEELKRASGRELCWGDRQVLRRYQRQRHLDNELVMRSMLGFKMLFGDTSNWVSAIRNLGINGVDSSRVLKQRIVGGAMMSR